MNSRILAMALLLILSACGGSGGGEATVTDGITAGQHRVFVTSATYNGDLGGLDGADAKCASVASAAGLELTYKAILSDTTTNAKSRLSLTGQVVIVDSNSDVEVVAATSTDFWNSANTDLLTTISIKESGDSASGLTPWTGTTSEGAYGLYGCQNWSSSSSSDDGFHGNTSQTDSRWVDDYWTSCDQQHPLICISI